MLANVEPGREGLALDRISAAVREKVSFASRQGELRCREAENFTAEKQREK